MELSFGRVAQWLAQRLDKATVDSSSLSSTTKFDRQTIGKFTPFCRSEAN